MLQYSFRILLPTSSGNKCMHTHTRNLAEFSMEKLMPSKNPVTTVFLTVPITNVFMKAQ